MGAWSFIRPRFEYLIGKQVSLILIYFIKIEFIKNMALYMFLLHKFNLI